MRLLVRGTLVVLVLGLILADIVIYGTAAFLGLTEQAVPPGAALFVLVVSVVIGALAWARWVHEDCHRARMWQALTEPEVSLVRLPPWVPPHR